MRLNINQISKFLLISILLVCCLFSIFSELPADQDFTIVVLPDTQHYHRNADRQAILNQMIKWIVDNRKVYNIVYVAHVGDIVQTASSMNEWNSANTALSQLENPNTTGLAHGIPYGLTVGNHDSPTESCGNPDDPDKIDNPLFDSSRFSGMSYYGGSLDIFNHNSYNLFQASNMKFIVLNLNFFEKNDSEKDIMTWANSLMQQYSDRKAIIVSHSIINRGINATFRTEGNKLYNGTASYSGLKEHQNLLLMLCGHIHGEGRRTDIYKGNTVHTLLADYQDFPNGGDGWMRLLTFSPVNNKIHVRTYSPYKDAFREGSDSQFTLDLGDVPVELKKPVAFWQFNEVYGNIVYDKTPNNNDGIRKGAVYTKGKYGQALQFDGTNDVVDMGDRDNLEGMNQLTLSAWVYPTQISGSNRVIVAKEFVYKLDIASDGHLRFLTTTANGSWGGTILFSNTRLTANKWYHITATYDGFTKRLYINGAEDSSRSITGVLWNYSKAVTVGAYYYRYDYYRNFFKGVIDEVRIYKYALTGAEVLNSYQPLSLSFSPDFQNSYVFPVVNGGSGQYEYIWYVNNNLTYGFWEGALDIEYEIEANGFIDCNDHLNLELHVFDKVNLRYGKRYNYDYYVDDFYYCSYY